MTTSTARTSGSSPSGRSPSTAPRASRTGEGRRRSRRGVVVLAALVLVLLSACAAGPNEAASASNDAGFWLGLWHGVIAPFAFIVSLFEDSVGIYEVDNNGGWYDFGFILGLSFILSGSGAGSRGRRR